jgi:predicted phosphoribosyltransferase
MPGRFRNRDDAALQLARRLAPLGIAKPLVLAIPRGGVAIGAVLARELGGELDVVLARKLRAPYQRELAIGSIGEDGAVYLDPHAKHIEGVTEAYIRQERDHQIAEIDHRRRLFRAAAAALDVTGRSVIVTDDGVATGSTMLAALHVLGNQKPREVILAVPVAPPDTLEQFRSRCGRVVCLMAPDYLGAISMFYDDFRQVEDEEAVRLLLESRAGSIESASRRAGG